MSSILEKTSSPLRLYVVGFILCLFLTGTSYLIVSNHLLSREALLFTLGGLAFIQAMVQLYFFLHLGKESDPKWHTWAFFSMVCVIVILIVGSLWIMYHLNYRMMPSHD